MASEVHPGRKSRLKWLSQNWRYGLLRDVGESCEQWKSRLESRWDSIIHELRVSGMSILKDDSELKTNPSGFWVDVIEVFKTEFIRIITLDAWEVFLYLTSYLLGLEYDIDDYVIWLWITKHDAIKIAQVIMMKDLPITLGSTPPTLLDSAASHHSFQVVEFLLITGIFSGPQVEDCLNTALSSAWSTLEKVISVVCSKKSPEEAINCFRLIATLCLPQMKPALSTIYYFACFMSDELLAKEACQRAKQGRFLDYALLLMVAPRKVLDFTDRRSFLDGLTSAVSSSESPVVFRSCILLFTIFSAVHHDFYKLWQSSEGLTQKGIVRHVYRTCKRAGLHVHYNDFKLLDAHTVNPKPKLSRQPMLSNVLAGPRILGAYLPKNIYPISFECRLRSALDRSFECRLRSTLDLDLSCPEVSHGAPLDLSLTHGAPLDLSCLTLASHEAPLDLSCLTLSHGPHGAFLYLPAPLEKEKRHLPAPLKKEKRHLPAPLEKRHPETLDSHGAPLKKRYFPIKALDSHGAPPEKRYFPIEAIHF